MANKQHVEIVRKGTKAIKQFRGLHPEVQLDLSEADLTRLDLSSAPFDGANLFAADLTEAKLVGTSFTGACLLGGTNFGYADVGYAFFHGAQMDGPAKMWASTIDLDLAVGLPHGLFADAVAAGYYENKRQKKVEAKRKSKTKRKK